MYHILIKNGRALTPETLAEYERQGGEAPAGWVYDPDTGYEGDPQLDLGQSLSVLVLSLSGVDLGPSLRACAMRNLMDTVGIAVETETSGAVAWEPGQYVETGAEREYNDKTYACVLSHVTQGDWTPNAVPALWRVTQGAPPAGGVLPWIIGETVKAGDKRAYDGKTYVCVQGHTTQDGWQPPGLPALWSVA